MDILPRKEDELKNVLAAGKVELGDDQLKEILKVIRKYRSS
jgi:DNA-directed RNA polymerase subunit F